MLQARENLIEAIQVFLKKYDQIHPKEKSMALLLAEERFLKIYQVMEEEQNQPENIQELLLKLINDLQILNGIQLKQEDQAAKVSSQYWKPPIFYDDDDEESSIPLRDILSELPLSVAITPDLPITNSLIMEDEHLNTIPKTESDEENESSVKDLNLTLSESEDLSEDLSDNESECDVPVCDDFSPNFMTFSNPLFDSNDDFTSSDDDKIDPLYNEIDSIPQGNDNDHFNAEFDLIESLLNRDISMVSSPKIDSLLEELSGELFHIDLIPPEINEADFDPEEDIRLGDVLFLEELLNDDSISLLEYESFHVDFYNVPSSPRPPKKPPDDDVYFDIVPNMGVLTTKVVDDIYDNSTRELYVHVPNVLPTLPPFIQSADYLLVDDSICTSIWLSCKFLETLDHIGSSLTTQSTLTAGVHGLMESQGGCEARLVLYIVYDILIYRVFYGWMVGYGVERMSESVEEVHSVSEGRGLVHSLCAMNSERVVRLWREMIGYDGIWKNMSGDEISGEG
ncbi:hypothetical protein Tco_0456400 [Tanacetum coccineum]